MTSEALAKVAKVAQEHAEQVDREAQFPHDSLAAMRSSGLLGMFVPAEYGGLGDDINRYAHIAGRLAASCASTAAIWVMHSFQVDALTRYGSERLRRSLLPKIAAGDIYIASVTTEAGRGADLFGAEAPIRAIDDWLHFEREAPIVTGGRHADGFLITLRAHPDAGHQEVSLVYASRDELELGEQLGWDPLGMRGTESIGLALTGSVPKEQLIGEPGLFSDIAWESMVPLAHIGWSATWLGAARGAFAQLLNWLREPARKGGPDMHSELLRDRLGRIRVDLDLVGAYLAQLTAELTRLRAEGRSWAGTSTRLRVNSVKLAASELTSRAADDMVQIAGMGSGYSKLAPIPFERYLRDLRSARLNHSNDRLWPATGALTLLDPKVRLLWDEPEEV